jgi:hypothetical protein
MPRLSLRAANALRLLLLVVGGTGVWFASILWFATPTLFYPYGSEPSAIEANLRVLALIGAWLGYAWMIRIAVARPPEESWFRSTRPDR